MFKLEKYIDDLISALQKVFNDRLLYVGLQGSYLRNEAHGDSDIDIMCIIESITVSDLDTYRNVLMDIGYFDKACGFICGKDELLKWNPLEICQILHTTKDYYGQLVKFVPAYTLGDERNYVKLSIGNLYHNLCHRYIYSDRNTNVVKFSEACKAVFFILQNMHYLSSGVFCETKRELAECVCDEDKQVLKILESIHEPTYNFDEAFTALFIWCQKALARL